MHDSTHFRVWSFWGRREGGGGLGRVKSEEVGHKNQILELVNESLLVVVLKHTEADPSLIPEQNSTV